MNFDATFWVAVSFVLLAVISFKPLRRIIVSALDDRSSQIQKELEEAVRLKEEAEDLLVSYKKKKKEVLEDAKNILEHAEKEISRMTKEAEETLAVELNRRKAIAMEKIASYEVRVLEEIRNKAIDDAIRAVHNLAAEHMGQKTADALVESAVANISKKVH